MELNKNSTRMSGARLLAEGRLSFWWANNLALRLWECRGRDGAKQIAPCLQPCKVTSKEILLCMVHGTWKCSAIDLYGILDTVKLRRESLARAQYQMNFHMHSPLISTFFWQSRAVQYKIPT